MSTNKQLRSSSRSVFAEFFVVSVLTVALVTVGGTRNALAQAQEGGLADDELIEEILVTGSRLRTTGLDTPSPVTILSREDIEYTNLSSTGELLRELPLSGARSATETAGRGNSGVATVALRGLPAVNTLVLMNGRRMLATNDNGEVDLNSIPFEAIERIEILQDGASAVYGSDAIAGVVNLIMRDSYDGLSLNAYYGISDRSDAELTNFSLTFGTEFEQGGFIFVASRREQNGYLIAARPCCRDADQRGQGGANLRDPLPVPVAVRGLDPLDPSAEMILRDGVTQGTSLADFRPFVNNFFGPPAPDDAFNYFEFETSMSDSTLENFWFSGHYDLTPAVTGFVEVASNYRESFSFLAPDAFGEVFGDPIFIHANNDFNPFGIEMSAARTIIEQGAENVRQQSVDSHTQRVIVGLRGEFGAGWDWEVSLNNQRLDEFRFGGNVTSRTRLQQAAGDSDECRAAANSCVPINLLGAAGTITQDMLDFILVPGFSDKDAQLDSLQFNLTGTAFSMPAGDVQVAFGAEYREETFDIINDSFHNAGDIIFSGTSSDAHPPRREVTEVYFETSLPIFDGFDVDLAVRYSDYNQFGTTTNPKVGLRWRPLDSWLIRGSFGTGFRAPNFEEAFSGQSRGFRNITDPCEGPDFNSFSGCMGMQAPVVTGAFVLSGGNPNLQPEETDNYTVGVVWTPSNVDRLSVTLDAFRIEKDDVIRTPDVNFIIDQNVKNGLFPGAVTRDSNFRIQEIIALLGNIGEQEVQGLDFGIDYQTRSYSIGSFAAKFDLTYLDEFKLAPAPGVPSTNRVGLYESGLGSVAEIRSNGSVRWFRDDWSANYNYRFVDGVTNVDGFASNSQEVDSYLQHDLSVTYDLNDFGANGTVLTFGIENILDEDAPFVEGNFQNGYDQGSFNSRGRYYFLRAQFNL